VVDRGRSYRGVLEATAGAGPLRLINQLDVETYVKGMGEVPSSWPVSAIAAQAIAARTYALRAMSFSGEICDYDLCQVYIGAGRETISQNMAVDGTRSQVIIYGKQLASAVYSADAGGVSANTFEGFGTPAGSYPYLTNVRYDTDNPLPWHTEVAMADVARRFGYTGTLTGVSVSATGPSGRALEMTLDGTSGPLTVEGRRFASQLGLRSTLFTTTSASAAVAPPPPADLGDMQALPEDTAAITGGATQGEAASDAAKAKSAKSDATKVLAALAKADLLHDARDLADDPVTGAAAVLLAAATAYACAKTETERRRLELTTTHSSWR
jgi:stage II sporulation protein D